MSENRPSRRPARDWRALAQVYGPLAALAVLVVGTALVERLRFDPEMRAFLKVQNLLNILHQQSYVGIIAVGMTFVIILAGIDLSVGAMFALLGGAAVYALNATFDASQSTTLAITAAFAVCMLGGPVLGGLNGLAVTWGRIAPFIATLGTMVIFRSLIVAPAEASEIRSQVMAFEQVARGAPPYFRTSVVVFLVLAVLAQLLLTRTSYGLQVFAIGDNARAARYAGIKVERVTLLTYALLGFTCGVSALLFSSRLNAVATSSYGLGYELDAIAAVVIGGTRLQGGVGRVWGTVIGVLILGVVNNMLNMLAVSNHYQGLVKGLIILAAVLVQPGRARD